MTWWPEWGPQLGIPQTKKELANAVFWNTVIFGAYMAFYAWEVWRTIPRMAPHHYLNPSRNAIVRQAMRQSIFPSFTRGMTIFRLWGPAAIITGMIVVRELVGEKNSYQSDYDRIDRARTMAMGQGYYTGTHDMGFHFGNSPHTESRYGDVWYSFHPEWI